MLLNQAHRPVVQFDPANAEHRKMYAEFARTKTWGKCPVRFEVPADGSHSNLNLAYSIQNMLVEYYIQQEFKS